jgi:O-antigen ligase
MTGRDLRRPGRGAGIALAPLAAVAVGVFADGGYSPGARLAFGVVALAAAALALALACDRRALRDPLVLLLLALAALGALSALWTLGPVERTLRWALVCAGYAAVAVAAAAAARERHGLKALAAGLGLIAAVAGAIGLAAVSLAEPPYAERIAGVWRPGGPFEYPPALALLEVSALPVLLAGAACGSRVVAGAGAVGLAVAGGVLALSASRVGLALAVAVAGLALVSPARRVTVAAALALTAAAGLALRLVAGGPAAERPGEAVRVLVLVAVVSLAAPLWLALRAALRPRRRPMPLRAAPAAVVVLALALLAGSLGFGADAGRGAGADSGFLHGRESTWAAAIETFADRPFAGTGADAFLAGTGADAFLAGSARHQDGQTILFAHDLPLELAAELGIWGLALAIALYAATGRWIWSARGSPAAWLLGPAAAAFLIASLVDWPWHLAGSGAIWALAAGAIAGAAGGAQKVALTSNERGNA